MKFSVCIDAVFRGHNPIDSLETVKACGFKKYEFWSWWDKDIVALKKKADNLGLECVAICTYFVSLTNPAERDKYLDGLEKSIEAARRIGCKVLISQAGGDTGKDRESQHQSIIEGLRKAASLLEKSDITLVLEPLNIKVDHPGYFLFSSTESFRILDKIGSTAVKLLFDIYHQQITEGDIIRTVTSHLDQIGHFHAAGNPGRHDPNNGELDYRNIFRYIEGNGYHGSFGLEYFPLGDAKKSLEQLRSYFAIL